MGHSAISDEFGEELSPYRSRVVYEKVENLRWARKAGNACECQDGGIQGWELRHYPGAQGCLGMDLEGRHGPHKNSNIRKHAKDRLSSPGWWWPYTPLWNILFAILGESDTPAQGDMETPSAGFFLTGPKELCSP